MTVCWQNELENLDTTGMVDCALEVDGIQLLLSAVDHSLLDWAEMYMTRFAVKIPKINIGCCVCVVTSDRIFYDALKDSLWESGSTSAAGYDRAPIKKLTLASGSAAYLDCHRAVMWHVNKTRTRIVLLLTARTIWPALEFARLVREIAVRKLEAKGWVQYHSAAVSISGRVVLILGGKGTGKTTTMLSLVEAGAGYLSNDRVLIYKRSGKFDVLTFPNTIDVGLGSLLNFQIGTEIIKRHYEFKYPQRRIDPLQLSRLPVEEWQIVKGKICLLPDEFIEYFGAADAVGGGALEHILISDFSPHAGIETTIHYLAPLQSAEAIDGAELTRANDHAFPYWLDLNCAPPVSIRNSVASLPVCHIRYGLKADGLVDTNKLASMIMERIAP